MNEENTKWLLDYLKKEREEVRSFIIERGIANGLKESEDLSWLFEIDMDSEEFQDWDTEHLENHNWDSSRYRCLTEIIDIIEQQINKVEDVNETKEI